MSADPGQNSLDFEEFICSFWALSARENLALPAGIMAEAAAPPCDLCGRNVPGRKHGQRFLCTGCETVDKMLRRNIGALPPMDEDDRKAFFAKATTCKDGPHHQWRLVRAALKESWLTRKVKASGIRIDGAWKPQLYWEKQGYSSATIEQCPQRQDPLYGTLYQIKETTEIEKEFEEQVEQELLERESLCRRKKAAKKAGAPGPEDYHVPEADAEAPSAATGKKAAGDPANAEKAEAKEKAREEREAAKRAKNNAAACACAAKALAQLQPKLEGLKVAAKLCAEGADLDDCAIDVKEAMDKVSLWIQKSRDMVAAQAACPAGNLEALPYDQSTLKATVQASGDTVAWVKRRVKENKRKSSEAKAETQPEPKRRRTKKTKET